MGKKKDLSAAEKCEIAECLGQGMNTLDISRKLKRDHRTVKRFVADSEHTRARADKGTMRKVSARQLHEIEQAAAKMPSQSSKRIFEAAGASGVPPTSRCRILQRLAVHKHASPLTKAHEQKWLQGSQTRTKAHFQAVVFTDECGATLDGPDDGEAHGWWTTTVSHEGCDVSEEEEEEEEESSFGPESVGESWAAPLEENDL